MAHRFIQLLFSTALLLSANSTSAQCGYCNSFEDFMEDKWIPLDTLINEEPNTKILSLWNGNRYMFTTGNKKTDKILKKKAFVVKRNDTLFVNCRNLILSDERFGNGYTPTKRLGKHSMLFVNKLNSSQAIGKAAIAGLLFGAVGGAVVGAIEDGANSQAFRQVCFIISSGENRNGDINARMLNDEMMDMMMADHEDLKNEFYSEKSRRKRLLASYVIPILEKAGLFTLNSSNTQ